MYKYRIGVVKSDMGGCFQYRVLQPFNELRRLGVDYTSTAYLPTSPFMDPEDTLVQWVEQFDLIMVQRCFKYDVFQRLRRACDIAGRKLVFETDDDYINLPAYNPCHAELNAPGVMEGFKNILRESDHITVTTQELKDVYYQYNKNITVLPNNVENVTLFKDEFVDTLDASGKIHLRETFGFIQYPSFVEVDNPNTGKRQVEKLFRLGYTATPTHRQDFLTIKEHLGRFLEKFPNTIMFYFGDEWFLHNHPSHHKNVVFMRNMPHDLYMQNIRIFDLGIAPLVPDIFNMGKSSLKLLEYGSWGIPGLAPDYITYNRHFKDGETFFGYKNGKEFYDKLCIAAEDHSLRQKVGLAAANMVHKTRTERENAQERFDLYESIIEGSPKELIFTPNKELTLNGSV